MELHTITLHNLLPLVFAGMESTQHISHSRIWNQPQVVFERGCRICLQAESGAGKSSLLSYIIGDRNDYRGKISFDGDDVAHFDISRWCEIRTSGIALMPQEMRLFPELTVMQNIELKNRRTRHKTTDQIMAMLEGFGIAGKRDVLVAKLSIGQQQRVALIRTLCQPFSFILLDEPVSHLDEANNRLAARLVEQEAAAQGAGIITTSVGNSLLLDKPQFMEL